MNKRLAELITEEFGKIISEKTGWGKNEVMQALSTAVAAASLRLLDERGAELRSEGRADL